MNRFEKWLDENGYEKQSIGKISKKSVISYFNQVVPNTSPRTRNKKRIDLGSLFQTLEGDKIIVENFIKKINVLKSIHERNKTYSYAIQNDIFEYLEENNPVLFLFVKFIKFVSYNSMKPIKVKPSL